MNNRRECVDMFAKNFTIRCDACNNIVVYVTTGNNNEGSRKTYLKCQNKKCKNKELING